MPFCLKKLCKASENGQNKNKSSKTNRILFIKYLISKQKFGKISSRALLLVW